MTFGVRDTANTFTIAIVRHSKNGLNQQQNKTKSSSLTTKKQNTLRLYVRTYVRTFLYIHVHKRTD